MRRHRLLVRSPERQRNINITNAAGKSLTCSVVDLLKGLLVGVGLLDLSFILCFFYIYLVVVVSLCGKLHQLKNK